MIEIRGHIDGLKSLLGRLEARLPGEDEAVRIKVQEITEDVRVGGRQALLGLRKTFEQVSESEPLILSGQDSRLASRASECSVELRSALRLSVKRVSQYHEVQRDRDRSLAASETPEPSWAFTSRVQALDRVAVYVPGGRAFYPSSVIMSVVPAKVAGVAEIAVITPYRSLENPAFAATLEELGVHEVLLTGGAQGVAAAAYGFDGFARCDKIVGPGNVYVATAKHLLSGRIGIDSFAGPSEILVLGDGSSDPAWIAADLVAQAEHDEQASAIFASTCQRELEAVAECLPLAIQAAGPRASIAREAIHSFGGLLKVDSREELVAVSNAIHPEHLHIHTRCGLNAKGRAWWAQSLRGVGAVFFGRYCSEAYGDYLAGPSHVLPTAGTARFSSPLGVYDFIRRSSLLWMDQGQAEALAEATALMADAEELPGHARSARLRSSGADSVADSAPRSGLEGQ